MRHKKRVHSERQPTEIPRNHVYFRVPLDIFTYLTLQEFKQVSKHDETNKSHNDFSLSGERVPAPITQRF